MIRKFCSVKEAAERLDATEDQIENLLSKGMLREFRNGPHRLLRTADVGAIVVARNRRLERQGQPRTPATTGASSSGHNGRSQTHPAPGRATGPAIRLPRSAAGAPQSVRRNDSRPKIAEESRQAIAGPDRAARRPRSAGSPRRPSLSDRPRAGTRRADPEVRTQRQTLSLREWFWTGLLQDDPVAIILLCGCVLLILSAVAAGAYLLKDVL